MVVTFVVNGQLFGIEQEFAMEAVDSSKAFLFHGASGKARMAVQYKGRYVAVINLREIFNQTMRPLENPYLLVIGQDNDFQVAIEVDDLNSVLELNESDVKPAPNIGSFQSCLSGVACIQSKFGNQFLFLLDHTVLLSRKELGELFSQLDKIQ
jgi:chemotaxis signal transduction protein